MAEGNGKLAAWVRWWPIVLTLLSGIIAFTSLRKDVQRLEADMGTHARRDVVETELRAINLRLTEIRDELRDTRRRGTP